jgi:hypothetical protein
MVSDFPLTVAVIVLTSELEVEPELVGVGLGTAGVVATGAGVLVAPLLALPPELAELPHAATVIATKMARMMAKVRFVYIVVHTFFWLISQSRLSFSKDRYGASYTRTVLSGAYIRMDMIFLLPHQ